MGNRIRYYSTNLKAPEVSFREALLNGLAPDGGLYMPCSIPLSGREEMESFCRKEYHEIAANILLRFLKEDIDKGMLEHLCREAYNFNVPLEEVTGDNYILRLDMGPTASFKDFAARIMARLMNHYAGEEGKRFTILTATSGDTGGAVASAFRGLDMTDVVVLFPAEEVSCIQRRQMTTMGGNIHAVAINGKFDDCQRLVKQAFRDHKLSESALTSANSINIGRLLPQAVYYFYAWSRVAETTGKDVVFSVPSGNFGNLMGGLIAMRMGLPVKRFIVATNSNNEVPEYLRTGIYNPVSPSINCISSAMNVGHPSNLARIASLYGGVMDEKGHVIRDPDLELMRKDMYAVSISEEETRNAILSAYEKYGILLEPHGAVAWLGLESFPGNRGNGHKKDTGFISLETAHPAKFPEEINRILGIRPEIPAQLQGLSDKEEFFTELDNNYSQVRDYILNL